MPRVATSALIAVSFAASGCAMNRADGSPKIETTSEANRENVQRAVSAPLRDVNLLRTKIPQVLLDAIADPYARPQLPTRLRKGPACAALTDLVQPLDEALGPDLDVPGQKDGDLRSRGRSTALGFIADTASDTIPFRGWVRKLSGAERHDHLVQEAITAGFVRRAYLKGLGEARGCNPPATPSHVKAGTTAPVDRPGPAFLGARYPAR